MAGVMLLQLPGQVWVATARFAAAAGAATPEDRAGTAGMKPWRAREFLAGRGLLRTLLADVCPDAADAGIVPGPRGRPELRGRADWGISVAHDRDTAAVAVACGRAVGVDVQHPDAAPDPGMIRRCLGRYDRELTHLSAAEQATELAWVWTVQEACVKATGEGIAGRPWLIDVPPGRTTGAWRGHCWVSFRGRSALPLSCAYGPPDSPAQAPVQGERQEREPQ